MSSIYGGYKFSSFTYGKIDCQSKDLLDVVDLTTNAQFREVIGRNEQYRVYRYTVMFYVYFYI